MCQAQEWVLILSPVIWHIITVFCSSSQELRIREWERERRMRIRQKEETGAFQGEQWKPDRLRG